MTVEADLGLRGLDQDLVLERMRLVAGRAGDVIRGVGAQRPMHPQSAGVATHADLVLLLCRRRRAVAEDDVGRGTLFAFRRLHQMRLAISVAGLALPVGERSPRVGHLCVRCVEDERHGRLVVAFEAHPGALAVVGIAALSELDPRRSVRGRVARKRSRRGGERDCERQKGDRCELRSFRT